MKVIYLCTTLLFSTFAMSQEPQKLSLPKAEEIDRIEISNTSRFSVHKPEDLIKILPDFVAVDGTYLDKIPFQRGKFLLKNGKEIKWMAANSESILLYEDSEKGSKEQLFYLRGKEPEKLRSKVFLERPDVKKSRFRFYFIEYVGGEEETPLQKLKKAFSEKIKIHEIASESDLESVKWKTVMGLTDPIFTFTKDASVRLLKNLTGSDEPFMDGIDNNGFLMTFDNEIIYWGRVYSEPATKEATIQQVTPTYAKEKLTFTMETYYAKRTDEYIRKINRLKGYLESIKR